MARGDLTYKKKEKSAELRLRYLIKFQEMLRMFWFLSIRIDHTLL